jgi:hypothetical protein
MPRFDPEAMLRVLSAQEVQYVLIGGLAATLHGSPLRTGDADICPAREAENLERLAAALRLMDARVRRPDAPDGLPFACDGSSFRTVELVNLTTRFGDLDVTFVPSGTGGYHEFLDQVVEYDLGGLVVPVAGLADIIRSKEAADREKDRAALPTLRTLLARMTKTEG